ncbi:amino acid ABC transporter permease [Microbacterium barkeri]|uniref:Amino acid ABC transporter permease n=1 Tax=Microbacterium barkeri TaxID=33917 RepID=A0A9W6H0M0_9MICO|nr:amino acid ABC transporter permease [Microbacterium barkeri]MDI6942061.1 amino acid ABC transporter permease [Microbacterium barkeri]MDR6875934.1 polar amino acid transport system permease protein [Microbacterium barkeri]GLJ60052.1 amino acid ABC transporter permease [Microbacterium barkeri]
MALTARQRARTAQYAQAGLFVALIVVLAIVIDWPRILDSFFDFPAVAGMFPGIILVGLKNTIVYTIVSFALGLALGMLLALMKLSSFAPYRWIATAYIEFFRGIPALLVFIAFGFGVPAAFPGTRWPTILVVMLSLGIVAAAYIAETLRAGLQAVPRGQYEAARSLGMPGWRAMLTIVIPQAFRMVLPPLTNEFILVTKDTSLIYVIGLAAESFELTKLGRDGILQYGAGITPLVVAGAMYLIITLPLSQLSRRFESRSARTRR